MKPKSTLCFPICDKCPYVIKESHAQISHGCKLSRFNITGSKCAAAFTAAALRGDICKNCMKENMCIMVEEVRKRVKEKTFT